MHADLQSELESVSSKLSEVTAAKNNLAQAATCFESEKAICQTSTETYSKVVIESAKELGKLHQQIEELEADIAEKDLEIVRPSFQPLPYSVPPFQVTSMRCTAPVAPNSCNSSPETQQGVVRLALCR